MAQSGSAPALGAGSREFESLYPDQSRCACSSTGQSIGLLSRGLKVRVLPGAPMVGVAQQVELRIVDPVAHEDGGMEDMGFSAALAFDPAPGGGRGPSLGLRRDLGGRSAGGAAQAARRRLAAGRRRPPGGCRPSAAASPAPRTPASASARAPASTPSAGGSRRTTRTRPRSRSASGPRAARAGRRSPSTPSDSRSKPDGRLRRIARFTACL